MAIDLFLVGGQSNAVGRGNAAESPSVLSGVGVEYVNATDTIIDPLDDPVQGNNDAADTGSAWPAFLNEYNNLSGRNIAIVGAARGGSAQNADADEGSGNWDSSGSLQDDAVMAINNAISKLEGEGYDVNFRGVLWHQGDRDAQEIDAGGIAKSDYKTAFENMITSFRDDLNMPNMPFWVFELGQLDSGDTSGFQDVRDAQNEVALSDVNTSIVSDIQKNFPSENKMSDEIHYDQTGYNEMGEQGATNITNEL